MSSLRALWGTARRLGMNEETMRAIAGKVTKSETLKGHSSLTYNKILDQMNGIKASAVKLDGLHRNKILALWISAHNLGVIENSSDNALCAFVKRQTGIDQTNWLHNKDDADMVIGALKSWLAREGCVDWSESRDMHLFYRNPQYKIGIAIFVKIWMLSHSEKPELSDFLSRISEISGIEPFQFERDDWINVHKTLGNELRTLKRHGKVVCNA
ncbi:MAG: regulatory protein GemA [Cohaesibacteraceae bacterium]|nr:regulatory protein GemA [Cohaesibacteraceae bacterium]MBL4877045.1 regulatory protein GemA [Cohaesibacteraceae bacterium]